MACKRLRRKIGGQIAVIAIGLSVAFTAPTAAAMSISDLACGAKLCLAGDGGSPCAPFLKYYKSIDGVTSSITKRLRKAFLSKCEDANPPNPVPIIAAREKEIEEAQQTQTTEHKL